MLLAFVQDPRTHHVPMPTALARSDALGEYPQHTGSGLLAVPPGVPEVTLGVDGTPVTTATSPFLGEALFG